MFGCCTTLHPAMWIVVVASLMGPCVAAEQAVPTEMGALMNLRARRTQKVVSSDTPADQEVAKHIRRLGESPTKLAAALSKGVEAIQSSVLLFQQEPPKIPEGISAIGISLLECIDVILTPEGKAAWAGYQNFTQSWHETFRHLPASVNNITQEIREFSSTGKPAPLIHAISEILDLASKAVFDSAPPVVGKEISMYFGSLRETVSSLGEAIVGFENGDIVGGIEDLYFGLRRATEPLIPAELQKDATYNTIIGSADSVVGGLSKNILEYRQRLMQSDTCWKNSVRRDRTRPAECSEGYAWDGESHCWPVTESCWEPAPSCVSFFVYQGQGYENCTTARHNRPWCSHNAEHKLSQWSSCIPVPCKPGMTPVKKTLESSLAGKRPAGTFPALCNADSNHTEKIDNWCFAKCPNGYHGSDSKCWTTCAGKFPADDDQLMCGRDPAALIAAKVEMVATVARSALTAAFAITKMSVGGVDAKSLSATIQAFVDVGKPFTRPLC